MTYFIKVKLLKVSNLGSYNGENKWYLWCIETRDRSKEQKKSTCANRTGSVLSGSRCRTSTRADLSDDGSEIICCLRTGTGVSRGSTV